MDEQTRAVYETHACEWVARRQPRQLDAVDRLRAHAEGPSVDLGCGPGWHTSSLPAPALALDVAKAMLDLVPTSAPAALRVQCDLEHLPLRSKRIGAAWARNSYVHLARDHVPMALADLHRAMREGGKAMLAFFIGDGEGRDLFDENDFPGRYFSRWDLEQLRDVVTGAGFHIDGSPQPQDEREHDIQLDVTRARTLPDIVGPNMRVLVCGLNPSLYAADAGIGFARPGNRFWPAALQAGLASQDRDPVHAFRAHGIGFTDLVKRATVAASELTDDEYRSGLARLERLVTWHRPQVVAFVGLAGWRAAVDRRAVAGRQERTIGGRPVYVMPSSSGLNAHSSVADLARHLRAALKVT